MSSSSNHSNSNHPRGSTNIFILSKYYNFDAANFRYTFTNNSLKPKCLLKYKSQNDNLRKQFYVKTTNLKLGYTELSYEKDEMTGHYVSYCYYTFYFDEMDKQTNIFKKLMNLIDSNHIGALYKNSSFIDENASLPLTYVETHYTPFISNSQNDLTNNKECLKIKVRRDSYDGSLLEIFDQDNNIISDSMLKPNYNCKLLLHHVGIGKSGSYFYPIWEIKQIKVEIPEKVFDECVLSDDETRPESIDSELADSGTETFVSAGEGPESKDLLLRNKSLKVDAKLIWDFYEDYNEVEFQEL